MINRLARKLSADRRREAARLRASMPAILARAEQLEALADDTADSRATSIIMFLMVVALALTIVSASLLTIFGFDNLRRLFG